MSDLIRSIYSPPKKKHSVKLSDFYGPNREVVYYSLARHALKNGLISLGLKAGDQVLIPSFICRDVLAPFNELNIKINFYNVNEQLEIVALETLPKAHAIMAVHYFGLVTNLKPFQDYCKMQNAFLIEDNAHGLFSRNSSGELLGTQGDFGIISVRKTLPVFNGAMLIANTRANKITKPKIAKIKSSSFILKNLLRPMVAIFGIKILLYAAQLKRLVNKYKTGSALPLSNDDDEKFIPLEPSPVDIDKVFLMVDIEVEAKRRRELFYKMLGLANDFPIQPIRRNLSLNEVPYAFPFYCQLSDFDYVQSELNELGLEIINWPSLPTQVIFGSPPGFYKNLYFIKFLW